MNGCDLNYNQVKPILERLIEILRKRKGGRVEKKKEAGRSEEETGGKEGVDGNSGERQAHKYNGCLLSLRSFVPGMGSESAHGSRMQGFGYSPGKNTTSRWQQQGHHFGFMWLSGPV